MSDRMRGGWFSSRPAGEFQNKNIFARFFLFLGKLQAKKSESFLIGGADGALRRAKFRDRVVRPMRLAVSKEIEQSVLLGLLEKLFGFLLYAPLRMYGIMLLIFSLGSAAVENVRYYLENRGFSFLYGDVWAGICIIVSLILLLSSKKKTLASALTESRIASYLLFDLLGLEKCRFEKDKNSGDFFLVFILLGVVGSALTILLPVPRIILAVLIAVYLRTALVSPESGLLLSLAAMPFANAGVFRLMLAVAAFSFLIKCLRGKRNPRASFYGGILFAFSLLVIFAALILPGPTPEASGLIYLMLGGMLAGQLMDRREQVLRAVSVFSFAAFCSAMQKILIFTLGILPGVIDPDIPVSIPDIFSGFDGGEFFGVYLLAALPLTAALFLHKKKTVERLFVGAAMICMAAALMLSRAPYVWLAFSAMLAFSLILISWKHAITVLLGGAAVAVGYLLFLPDAIKEKVVSFSSEHSTTLEGVASQFADSAKRFFFGTGSVPVRADGDFYGRLITLFGLIGLLLFICAIVGCFAFAFYAANRATCADDGKRILRGFVTSLFGVICAGVVCDLQANGKSAFLIFFLFGMILSCGRVMLRESENAVFKTEQDVDVVYMNVRVFASGKMREKAAKLGKKDAVSAFEEPDDADGNSGPAEDAAREDGGEEAPDPGANDPGGPEESEAYDEKEE